MEPLAPPPQPLAPPPTPEPTPATPAGRGSNGLRRSVLTGAMVLGLLAVGGSAVVLAADPSASPAPSATTQPSTDSGASDDSSGSTDATKPDCPEGEGRGGGQQDGDSSTTPSTETPSATPAT
jgi:hypothetical protein